MRRAAGGFALALALLSLAQPAHAAIRRERVLGCRASNRTCWPAAFAFTPDGVHLVYAERFSGHIRTRNRLTGADARWARVTGIAKNGEQGLLGLALDPQWPVEQRIYVYFTNRSPLENRIARLTLGADGSITRQILARIPANSYHDGGVIGFGPDGMLYAVTGDAGRPSRSQDRSSNAGKVLRMTEAGGVPADNPFRSRTWSYGHRNSFGFAFDPRTGHLWQSENGPDCDDEINRIRKGRNYGWGGASGCPDTGDSGPRPVAPRARFNPVIAPTGVAFCQGCHLNAKTEGTLLVGAYIDGWIRRLRLNASRTGVVGRSRFYHHAREVLAMAASPEGDVHFSDRRGIYRLVRR